MSKPPETNKGKNISPDETGVSDGFVPVRARNRNRGQKRSFKERQDDTFNRFEVLDELNQQEVNPGLINLDHGLMDLAQEDLVIESTLDLIGDECQQLDVD